ncbi:hypothetical protein [Streptomyces sp. I05A-00742]|uniref:hypothetical protein n=1 Tax=Streptomyces sp. I05A-00742 TaxID=2732853 RepID=UPI001BB1EA21|nr:hypothetical protein [Streptomyces sp. I05A-00742]
MPEARSRAVTGRDRAPGEGVAGLLVPFLDRLADRAADVSPAVGDLLAGNVADLLVTLPDERAEERDGPPAAARDHLLPAGRRSIEDQDGVRAVPARVAHGGGPPAGRTPGPVRGDRGILRAAG